MADSYTYTNTTEELQHAADVGVAIHGTNGLIKSDGAGNITAATAGTDYVIPSAVPSIPTTSNLVKGDGNGALVAATPNTDYVTPSGLPVVVNPNLLDNAYFVGGGSQQGGGQLPINSRNASSYSGAVNTIDRWKQSSGVTLTLSSGGASISFASVGRDMTQIIACPEKLLNKTITISGLIDGELATATMTFPASYSSQIVGTPVHFSTKLGLVFQYVGGKLWFSLYAYTGTPTSTPFLLQGFKVELGSQQTLAHQENGVWVLNEIPDYAEEVVRCNPIHTYNLGTLSANATITLDANTGIFSSVETQIRATQGGSYTITITAPTGYTITDGNTSGSSLVLTPTSGKTMEISAKTISDSVIAVITKEW